MILQVSIGSNVWEDITMDIYPTITHHCKKCNNIKPITSFSKDKSKPSGYSYTCKDCRKEYQSSYSKAYFQKNKKRIAEYVKQKRKDDPIYRLKGNTRKLIGNSITQGGYSKNTKTNAILGCSYDEFISHLSSLFQEGMTLENYGEWQIDHIIPLAIAKTQAEILALNHYTNLQPLWWQDNLAKSNKLDW